MFTDSHHLDETFSGHDIVFEVPNGEASLSMYTFYVVCTGGVLAVYSALDSSNNVTTAYVDLVHPLCTQSMSMLDSSALLYTLCDVHQRFCLEPV